MKQILIVGGHSSEAADVAELAAFAQGVRETTDATVTAAHVDDIQWSIAPQAFQAWNGHVERSLASYDHIILRNKMRTYHNIAYALSRFCHVHGISFFNDYSGYFPATKLAQAIVFYEQQVPFLQTVYAARHEMLRMAILRDLTFPCILKDAKGAQGASNYLVHDLAELDAVLAREPRVDFIAQEYCPNDCDYRILVLGKHHLIIERRASSESHLNNTSQGANAALASDDALPPELMEQARHLMNVLQLTIAGIDVMPRKNTTDFYFLETNAQPQIFTGSFIDEKRALFAKMLADFSA